MEHNVKIAAGLPAITSPRRSMRTLADFDGDQGMYDQYLAVKAMARRMDKQRQLAEESKSNSNSTTER